MLLCIQFNISSSLVDLRRNGGEDSAHLFRCIAVTISILLGPDEIPINSDFKPAGGTRSGFMRKA